MMMKYKYKWEIEKSGNDSLYVTRGINMYIH